MKLYKNGLVVGKFSPLHKGHEFVIQTAINRCENVIIFSYSNPEFSGCEAVNREKWLRTLFPRVKSFVFKTELPSNDEDDTTHRRFVAGMWLALVNEPLDVVFTSESGGRSKRRCGDRYAFRFTRTDASEHNLPG